MESIIYYLVQIDEIYYQGRIDLCTFTSDEEQAFAFLDFNSAQKIASQINGIVITREVRYEELDELSNQYSLEYEALPTKERNRIESFCRTLTIGEYD